MTLVDANRANLVAGEQEGLTIHSGNALDEVTLEEAGIDKAMRFIAATPNAEVNILTAQLAVNSGVPEVSVLLRDSDARTFRSQLSETGITVIRAPGDIAAWEHALSSDTAAPELIDIEDGAKGSERTHDLSWQSDPLRFPLAVISNGERLPYTRAVSLSDGDQLFVLTRRGPPMGLLETDSEAEERSSPATQKPR